MDKETYDENELADHEGDYTDEELEQYDPDISDYDIAVFYNTYNLSILLDEIEEKILIVPDFQRSFVWEQKRASEFIDSLLRKLPVPAFFLYDDQENKTRLIVDGQQRLKSLYYYIKTGEFNGKPFKLTGNVHKEWVNKAFSDLDISQRKMLERTLLNCTVMRQVTPDDSHSSMYLVFQRINTGGITLKPQEIRMSVSHGEFANWLTEKAQSTPLKNWDFLRLERERTSENYHRIQELIVRVFALFLEEESYSGNMRRFIDDFFGRNKNFDEKSKKGGKQYSKSTLEEILTCVLNDMKELPQDVFSPKSKPTIAFFEAVWLGLIYRKLVLGKAINPNNLEKHIRDWVKIKDSEYKKEFKEAFHAKRTTSKESVLSRFKLAKEYFGRNF